MLAKDTEDKRNTTNILIGPIRKIMTLQLKPYNKKLLATVQWHQVQKWFADAKKKKEVKKDYKAFIWLQLVIPGNSSNWI